jgi:hypothetical protein
MTRERRQEAAVTINELNELIARGAAQPGIRDIEELMRISNELNQQARTFAHLYGSVYVASSGSGVASVEVTDATHANVG